MFLLRQVRLGWTWTLCIEQMYDDVVPQLQKKQSTCSATTPKETKYM